MKATVRRTIGFLGTALMATQLIGASRMVTAPFRSSSGSFEQAMPLTPDQKKVQRLLERIASKAAIASTHADKLESFTRVGSKLTYEAHAAELMGAKDAINAMGADFRKLQELRPSALPWQQLVIDRIEPTLVGLAGHTTNAIGRLHADRGKPPSPEYRDAVLNMTFHAGQARKFVDVNLDYAQAREKLNRLDGLGIERAARVSQAPESGKVSAKAFKSLEQRVRTELLKLPYYGVFDHLAFHVNGDRITLSGDVSRPTLKADAERAIKNVEGVGAVTNSIKVLPVSPNDDRIRVAAYWAIYGHSGMAPYRLNPHPPIRIVVENGNVTLKGVVASEMDRSIAHMQASSVPGAFSVTNNLEIGS